MVVVVDVVEGLPAITDTPSNNTKIDERNSLVYFLFFSLAFQKSIDELIIRLLQLASSVSR